MFLVRDPRGAVVPMYFEASRQHAVHRRARRAHLPAGERHRRDHPAPEPRGSRLRQHADRDAVVCVLRRSTGRPTVSRVP